MSTSTRKSSYRLSYLSFGKERFSFTPSDLPMYEARVQGAPSLLRSIDDTLEVPSPVTIVPEGEKEVNDVSIDAGPYHAQ
jgi:hypothetical protein